MTPPLNRASLNTLRALAEHRLLTTSQLATLLRLVDRTARRQIKHLAEQGLIQISRSDNGPVRGRPEQLLALTDVGVETLKAHHAMNAGVPNERATGEAIRCVVHQLLLNSFRVQLHRLEGAHPAFGVQFLSSNSPFAMRDPGGQSVIHDRVGETEFVPDGAFSITHRSRRRTVLFFLEVDMGTETIGSITTDGTIRRKIMTYQSYFRTNGYKRYEEIFRSELNGFRLLFLTHTPKQLQALCALVAAMPPSDFIWLTDQGCMGSAGVEAAIWARGGRMNELRQSILGSAMPGSRADQPTGA